MIVNFAVDKKDPFTMSHHPKIHFNIMGPLCSSPQGFLMADRILLLRVHWIIHITNKSNDH